PAPGPDGDPGAARPPGLLLRGGRWFVHVPLHHPPVLRAGRRRRPAARDVPGGGPGPGRGAVADVPGAVLGRADHLLRDPRAPAAADAARDRKSTRLNSSHVSISYAV